MKSSRELMLLRHQLSSDGGSTLKLIEFVQKDGDRVAVDPRNVASVEERNATSSTILLYNGVSHTVEVAYADVVDALQE